MGVSRQAEFLPSSETRAQVLAHASLAIFGAGYAQECPVEKKTVLADEL